MCCEEIVVVHGSVILNSLVLKESNLFLVFQSSIPVSLQCGDWGLDEGLGRKKMVPVILPAWHKRWPKGDYELGKQPCHVHSGVRWKRWQLKPNRKVIRHRQFPSRDVEIWRNKNNHENGLTEDMEYKTVVERLDSVHDTTFSKERKSKNLLKTTEPKACSKVMLIALQQNQAEIRRYPFQRSSWFSTKKKYIRANFPYLITGWETTPTVLRLKS